MNFSLLEKTRLGVLISQKRDGNPIGVPVWFNWTGEKIEFFAGADSKKIARMERHPGVSLLVTNNVGEPEQWLAFDGDVVLCKDGGIELAEILAHRYWDMADPVYREKLNGWLTYPDAFVKFEMTPSKIRNGS